MFMKNCKAHYFVLSLILVAVFTRSNGQVRWGLQAGVNLANVTMVDETGHRYDTKSVPRVQLGLTVDIPIVSDLYVQPAALYSGKGFKHEDSWFAGAGNELLVAVSYIEVPVVLLYKPRLGIGHLLVGAGPYTAYGLNGKWQSDTDVAIGDILIENHGDVIFRNDVMDGEFGNYLYGRPWDYGASVVLGYEFANTFAAQLNAQWGLANLQPTVDGATRDGKVKNMGFGISLGYKF